MKEQQPALISYELTRLQVVVAKLNKKVQLLLAQLSERDKVGNSMNRLKILISTATKRLGIG